MCKLVRGSNAHRVRNLVAHLRDAPPPSENTRRMRSHACSIKKDANLAGQFVARRRPSGLERIGLPIGSNFHPSPLFPVLDVSGRVLWSGGRISAGVRRSQGSFEILHPPRGGLRVWLFIENTRRVFLPWVDTFDRLYSFLHRNFLARLILDWFVSSL